MVLLSAQGMDVPAIAKAAFTSKDRVRDVIRNFNADGFGSLYPKYKKIAKAKPAEYDLPFSWSLAKLADFVVAEGVVDDISHEGLRVLLREEGVTFARLARRAAGLRAARRTQATSAAKAASAATYITSG